MKKNPFVQGAMIATIGIVISKILGIVYVVPFYAIIGIQGGALYGYAYTIYNIFLNLSSVGIPLAISRLTSEYNSLNQQELKKRAFRIGLIIVWILGITSFLSLMFFAPNIADFFIGDIKGGNTIEDVTFVIRLIATAILVIPTLSVTKGYLQGHHYITVSTISQVLEQVVRVLVIIIGSYAAIKLLHLPIRIGVGIATLGATIGGLCAYLYIRSKMHKYKNEINTKVDMSKDDSNVKNKEIVIRIAGYASAFIFSSLALSFYDIIDLATILKTMVNGLHYTVDKSESVLSIFSTWGSKLNMIIASVAPGLLTSLVPSITNNFVKNNHDEVRNKINKSLQMLLYITIPMTIGLSVLAEPVWTVFYQHDEMCSSVFAFYIFMALANSTLATLNAIIQALNYQKIMFINISIGFIIKLTLNVPFMYLADKLGINPGYGAVLATVLGYSSSVFMNLLFLRRKLKVSYRSTVKKILRITFVCLVMVLIVSLLKSLIPFNVALKREALMAIILYGGLGSLTYFILTYKMNLIHNIFGEEFINKILRKLKIKKVREE